MTFDIILCLVLLGVTIVLFSLERLPVDIVTLLAICVLVIAGILTPEDAFKGFGSETLIILGSVFILGGALQQTGLLERIANSILRLAESRQGRLNAIIVGLSGGLSAFMNNTTVVAMLAPQVSSLAQRAGLAPGHLLLPLAFASILGGTCTLIGTSTNLAVSNYLAKAGFAPLGLFEVTPLAIPIFIVGFLYLLFVAPKLLPKKLSHTDGLNLSFEQVSDGAFVPIQNLPVQEISPTPSKIARNQIIAPTLFVGALLLGSSGVIPLSISLLCGAILVVLTGCLTPDQARHFVDWRLLILIGGMTAFGRALEQTGASALLADLIIHLLLPWGAIAVLAGFIILTIALTQPLSNAAAALVVLPSALNAAEQLQVNPQSFAIGIMLAASLSFITPLEPACIIIYGPGKLSFIDFIKVGGLLTLILATLVLLLLPLFFPL